MGLRPCHFRLGSGAVSPSGSAPRPLPSVPSRREPTLSADRTGAMICARTQMTKPRILAFGIVILSCLHCSALSESDMTIVDESDIGQSQYYTTALLRSHGDQSPRHAKESISLGLPAGSWKHEPTLVEDEEMKDDESPGHARESISPGDAESRPVWMITTIKNPEKDLAIATEVASQHIGHLWTRNAHVRGCLYVRP
jgi:hypothetical protein